MPRRSTLSDRCANPAISFALDREMPELHEGDLLAIMSAGAYGFVMASNYNSRPLPAEALVRGENSRSFGNARLGRTWFATKCWSVRGSIRSA